MNSAGTWKHAAIHHHCIYENPELRQFSCLSSFAVKRHQDHSNSYEEKYLIRLAYSLRGLSHYHDEKHSMQVDVGLEKELRVLDLDPQATTGSELFHAGRSLSICETSKPNPIVTYFLQQGCT